MFAKLQTLINSYVKISMVVMLCRVFSGFKPGDFFVEKWKILKKKKINEIQAFDLKSLLRASKRDNRIKLNTNKTIIFS